MAEILANLAQFHFLRPWFLLLLPIPLWLGIRFFKNGRTAGNWEKVCDPTLLRFLLIKGRGSALWLNRLLFVLGVLLGIVATAGPTWQKTEYNVLAMRRPVMFLLSLSSDMLSDDVSPTRLDRAKIELSDILKQLPSAESGLIVYSSEPFVISPLSADPALIETLLPAVTSDIMPSNGDRPDRAIDLAVERIGAAGFTRGNIVILAAESGIDEAQTLSAVRKAVRAGMHVSSVDFNVRPSADLEKTAQQGDGIYVRFGRDAPQQMADFLLSQAENDLRLSENMTQDWQDNGYLLVFAVLLCFLPLCRRGALVVVLACGISFSAEAGWFFSDAYQARKAFEEGDYAKAASLFSNPKWRGAAAYRAGNYEAATKDFGDKTDIETLYNKGNALAKSGRLEEAVAAYEAVLEADPNHEDAAFNLAYLKQQQQQQNQNQENNQDKEDNSSTAQNQPQNAEDNSDENSSAGQGDSSDDKDESQEDASDEDGNKNDDEKPDDSPEDSDSSDNDLADNRSDSSASEASAEENSADEQQASDNAQQNSLQPQSQSRMEDLPEDNARKSVVQGADSDKPYDEKVQAGMQKFRDIPEDKGGLLRAFIRQEYNKNRYGE